MESKSASEVTVRSGVAADRPAILAIVAADTFVQREIDVAMELVDSALAQNGPFDGDYWVRVAVDGENRLLGYICFGPTPMTDATYDLYWLCTHAEHRGKGVASQLLSAMESELKKRAGITVRVETSEEELYGAAQTFYARRGFREVGKIVDFYKAGDALLTFTKRLDG